MWQKKPWFRALSAVEKAAWFYLLAACDDVGVYCHDGQLANFLLGAAIDWEGLPGKVNGNIEVLANGKWWLPDFCAFQYGRLYPTFKGHLRLFKLLANHNLTDKVKSIIGPKDGQPTHCTHTTNSLYPNKSGSIISSSSPAPKDKEKDNIALQHAKDFARDYSQKTRKPCTAGFGTMTRFFKALRAAGVNDSDITATRKFFFAWEKRTCFGFDAFRRRFETLLPLATKSLAQPRAGPASWVCATCGYRQSNTSACCLQCGAERGAKQGREDI